MFISAKAFFEDNSANNKVLVKQAAVDMPREWVKRYKKNVVDITPKKTGALRRSIITQAIGKRAQIGWRSPYAGAQEQGQHAGSAPYTNYTTAGTGKKFAKRAFDRTREELPAIAREVIK